MYRIGTSQHNNFRHETAFVIDQELREIHPENKHTLGVQLVDLHTLPGNYRSLPVTLPVPAVAAGNKNR